MSKQICAWCSKEITAYSNDATVAAYERKRSLHWQCLRDHIETLLDNLTAHGGHVSSQLKSD